MSLRDRVRIEVFGAMGLCGLLVFSGQTPPRDVPGTPVGGSVTFDQPLEPRSQKPTTGHGRTSLLPHVILQTDQPVGEPTAGVAASSLEMTLVSR